MSENILISGIILGNDQKAIPGIKVSAYRDTLLLDQDFTYNEQGKYQLSIPPGTPITIRYDTSWSLTNARDWHPSIMTKIDARDNIVLPTRSLLRTWQYASQIEFIDALTAYQFCAMWTSVDPNRDSARRYAETAAARLSGMKILIPELREIQQILINFFWKLAHTSG